MSPKWLHRLPLLVPTAFVVTVLAVGAARLSGYDPGYGHGGATASRQLRFADQDDGSILVTDAATGGDIARLGKGTDNFLRATMRGLANARKQRGDGGDVPFMLSAHADGSVILQDPVTGRILDLGAFGPTNEAAFARFLKPAPASKTASL